MSTPFTYSNYSALRSCARKFRYSVVEKLPTPPQVHFEFGSALHAGLNSLLTDKDLEAAQDVFEAYWEGAIKLDFAGDRYNHSAYRDMGNKFLANFARKYAKNMQLVIGEWRFFGQWLDHEYTKLEGTPDALVEINGKNVLLDFKTSAYNYDPLKSDISLQLNLYAWLLTQNGYKVDQLCYMVFSKSTGSIQTPIFVDYDEKKALAMISEAVQYWKRNLGSDERNPNACMIGKSICPFSEKCWK